MMPEERDLLVTLAQYLIENHPGSRMAMDLELKLENLREADQVEADNEDFLHTIGLEAQYGQD